MIKPGDKIRFLADRANPASTVRCGTVSKILKDDSGLAYLVRMRKGKGRIVLDSHVVM